MGTPGRGRAGQALGAELEARLRARTSATGTGRKAAGPGRPLWEASARRRNGRARFLVYTLRSCMNS